MPDRLSNHNRAGYWARAVLSLLSGDYHDMATAIFDRPDDGRLEALVRGTLESIGANEWSQLGEAEASAGAEALLDVITEVSTRLRSADRDRLLADAIEKSNEWSALFTDSAAAVDARRAFGVGSDLSLAFDSANLLLADLTGHWIRENSSHRELDVAADGEALRRLRALADQTHEAARPLREAEAGAAAERNAITERVLARSQRLFEDLGESFSADESDTQHRLYVERDLQPLILARIDDKHRAALLVIGDAGYGKSSLLWGIARRLRIEGSALPVMVSATWLSAIAGTETGISTSEIVGAVEDLVRAGSRVVLLLDTADLLLHSDASVLATEELFAAFGSIGATVIATVRPVEAETLDGRIARMELLPYNDAETERATVALMASYFPAHAASEGVELVMTARSRRLPVLEVLQSPLLLRLLFDLAGDTLPAMELDVTELYWRYWERRVTADIRSRRDVADAADDLSVLAERVAITMLAEGIPELSTTALLALVDRVDFPLATDSPSRGLAILTSRGVLVENLGRRRFFHQTLFEFAAAVGLAQRAGPAEARRLARHMTEQPLDLFVGAVLEQLLILLIGERSSRPALTEVLSTLLESRHPTVAQIALMAWAHDPSLELNAQATLASLPAQAVERFLATLPQVATVSPGSCSGLLAKVWETRRRDCSGAVIRTMARLARRDGAGIASLFRHLDLTSYYSGEGAAVLTNPAELYDLLFALSADDPDLVRSASLSFLRVMGNGEVRAILLEHIAEHWGPLAADGYLDALVDTCAPGAVGRVVHVGIGRLLFAERVRSGESSPESWLLLARTSFAGVTPHPAGARHGAELAALAQYVLSDDGAAALDEILDLALGAPADAGPPQLVGLFFAPLLAAEGRTAAAVSARLADKLSVGLPVPGDRSGLSSAQNWAITARAAFADERVAPATVATLADAFADDADWLEGDRLQQLLPRAAAGGARLPAELIDSIADEPALIPAGQERDFLDAARETQAADRDVARAFIAVAFSLGETGPLLSPLRSAVGIEMLLERTDDLDTLIQGLLAGSDEDQRGALSLWKELQRAGVLAPTFAELNEALHAVRTVGERLKLIAMISYVSARDPEQALEALPVIKHYTRAGLDTSRGKAMPSPIVDAAFAAYRSILAAHATEEGWVTLKELVFARRVSPDRGPAPSRLVDVASYLRRFAGTDMSRAVERFAEVAADVGSADYSDKQRRNAAAHLRGVAALIVERANAPQLALILSRVSEFPRSLAEATIRIALRTDDGRAGVEDALALGIISGGVGTYAARKLMEQRRAVGLGALPELLSTADG